jgi:phage tail protein X
MTYQTTQGDTWDMISFKLFGNEYYVDQLVSANLGWISTQTFDSGVVLTVPAVIFPTSVSTTIWGNIVRVS